MKVPFVSWSGSVETEWIDQNDHMNSTIYPRIFHDAMRPFFRHIGMTEGYLEERGMTVFQREFRVGYEHELRLGEPIEIRSWLYDHDAKRVHHVHELWRSDLPGAPAFRAAFGEYMSLHVNLATRRTAPFPADVMARLDEMSAAFAKLPKPEGAGRAIGIPRG